MVAHCAVVAMVTSYVKVFTMVTYYVTVVIMARYYVTAIAMITSYPLFEKAKYIQINFSTSSGKF